MVDVLVLMVHPDLAGVVSMASVRAEMIGWLSREGYVFGTELACRLM